MEALAEGQIFYALRVDSHGNALADLTIWRAGHESFEVMSGRREEAVDLLGLTGNGLDRADVSAERAVFAIRGPGSLDVSFSSKTSSVCLSRRRRPGSTNSSTPVAEAQTPSFALISFRADARDRHWPWTPSRELKRPTAPAEIAVTSACESALAGGILGLGYVATSTPAAAGLLPRARSATFARPQCLFTMPPSSGRARPVAERQRRFSE